MIRRQFLKFLGGAVLGTAIATRLPAMTELPVPDVSLKEGTIIKTVTETLGRIGGPPPSLQYSYSVLWSDGTEEALTF